MRLPATALAAVSALVMASAAAPAAAAAIGDGSDIAALATGEPVARPLGVQLQLLFDAVLADAPRGATQALQVDVSYTYALAPEPAPPARAPVLFLPLTTVTVPADPAFTDELAGRIRQWFELYHPSGRGAELSFDLTATQPLERARGVTLAVADITDLSQPAMHDSGVLLRRTETPRSLAAAPLLLGTAPTRQQSARELGGGRWRVELS
jgi:hypothetical protein